MLCADDGMEFTRERRQIGVRVCVCTCMCVACYMKEGEMFLRKKVVIKSRKGVGERERRRDR